MIDTARGASLRSDRFPARWPTDLQGDRPWRVPAMKVAMIWMLSVSGGVQWTP